MGDLSNLTELRLNGNQLSGSIPVELGSLSALTKLYLSGNQLSGMRAGYPVRGGESRPERPGAAEVWGQKRPSFALYNATGGANWTDSTNWLNEKPIGEWHGVTTDDDGSVTGWTSSTTI